MVTSKPQQGEPHQPPFAQRLRAWCAAYTCSQGEMGRRLGFSRQTVHRWLHGESLPTPEHLPILARVTAIAEDEWRAAIQASRVSGRRASPGWSEHPRYRTRRPPLHTVEEVAPRMWASLEAHLDETLPPDIAARLKVAARQMRGERE